MREKRNKEQFLAPCGMTVATMFVKGQLVRWSTCMSRSLQESHERWQKATREWELSEIVEDPDLTNESCIIFESAHSTPMGEGATALPDFGDAICYYRYYRVPDELEPQEPQEHSSDVDALLPGLAILEQSWEHRRPKLSDDELHARRTAAEQALDDLLEEFVQQGYRAEMSKRLQEIVNHSLLDFELHEVYVLPGDLNALLSFLGNPLADYDAYENEAEAHSPAFDLNNPEHRAALKESICMFGR